MSLENQKRINKAIAESTAQQAKHRTQLELMQKSSDEITRYFQQMTQWVIQMMIINKLQEAWRQAVDYASEYYDALNEIRVVTGMTQEEADALGESYRQMAQEMNLTSTQIAKSAVDIYRQGYGSADDVVGVSKGASVFGAITKMDTDKAMETMTAALQNFQRDGESMEHLAFRIADSWSYLGDAVATEASDIGDAMSKVAGSAVNVGLSLEQTSAWAAVVMAKTQESAETIGTSLNSMITRYTKLTAGGFNSIITDEDGEEVAYNDVAKALQKVGIATYSAVEGFRDYGSVMDELGTKWKDLTSAEQNYIAFQMAGTRNMNRFITLMNGYEEATRLTGEALNSNGVAMEKYGVWMETVEAAQNNLENSLEDLYALLMDGSVVRGFYNGMASIVDVVNEGTEATGGLNIALPGIAAGIALITVAAKALTATMSKTGGMFALMQAHPIVSIATAFGALVTVATLAGKAVEYFAEADRRAAEATKALSDELAAERASIKKLADDIGSLEGVANPTTENVDALKNAITQLSTAAPDLAAKFNLDANAIDNFSGSVENAKKALDEYLKTERYNAFKQAHEGIGDAERTYNDAYADLYGPGTSLFGGGKTEAVKSVADMRKQFEWINNEIRIAREEITGQFAGKTELYGLTAKDILSSSMSISELESLRDQMLAKTTDRWDKENIEVDFTSFINGKTMMEGLQAELAIAEAQLETITADAKQRMQESIQVMISDVLNPAAYPELSFEDMLNIDALLGNFDYSGLNYDQARSLMTEIVANYNEEFRDVIENANWNMAALEEDGMSEAIYQSMIAGLNDPRVGEIKPYLNQLYGSYILDWTKARSDFKRELGNQNVGELIAAGFDTENLLNLIQTNLIGDLPDGVTMQSVIDQILEYDPSEGYTREGWIKNIFRKEGIETKQSITDLEAILKAGNTAINEQLQELGKLKIENSGFKDIFQGLLDGGSIQEIALGLARSVLGEGATDDAVAEYAKEIAEAFVGANPLIAAAMDSTSGTIKEGSEGIVESLKDMDVSAILNDLWAAGTDGDARAVIGEHIEGITTLQEAQKALETAMSVEKGTDAYSEAMQKVADYVQIPVEALGDLSLAQEIISTDMDEVNAKLLSLANTMMQAGNLKFDEDGRIVDATGETNTLTAAMEVLLEYCDYELGEDGLFGSISAQALMAANSVSALASLAGQIRDEESNNRSDREGHRSALAELETAFDEGGAEGMSKAFEDLDDEIRNGIAETYPELVKSMDDVVNGAEDSKNAVAKMRKEFDKADTRATAKNFRKTADAIGQLEKNAVDAEDAIAEYRDEMDALNEASQAFETLSKKGFTEDTADELDTLATYLGTTSDLLKQNWDASGISNALAQAAAEGRSALSALQEAAFIDIAVQGRSDVDFSSVQGQLIATEGLAAGAAEKLQRLGLFEVKTVGLDTVYQMLNPETGLFETKMAKSNVEVLVPTASNPISTGFKSTGSGGGGGGGGGGSSTTKASKKTQKKLDEVSDVKELYDYRLKLIG